MISTRNPGAVRVPVGRSPHGPPVFAGTEGCIDRVMTPRVLVIPEKALTAADREYEATWHERAATEHRLRRALHATAPRIVATERRPVPLARWLRARADELDRPDGGVQ